MTQSSATYTRPDLGIIKEHARHGKKVFQCPEKWCTYRVTLPPDGSNKKHPCPYLGGTTVIRSFMSLLSQVWEELDKVTEQIIDGKDFIQPEEVTHLKGQAVGLAKTIVIFHRPFFDEGVKAVSAEALKRYKAKKAGEQYETIGLNERRYEMPTSDKYVPTNQRPVAEVDPVLSEIQKLPDAHKASIRKLDKDPSVMAKLFGVSEEAIRRIRGER